MHIKRAVCICVACCCALLCLEALFFAVILSQQSQLPKPGQAELIAVFMGDAGRAKAGRTLYQQGHAPKLLFSPSTPSQLRHLPTSLKQGLLIEDQARTTFENALYTRRLVLQHNIRSVVLVTSDYHMPRSYFLFKSLLLNSGTTVYRYSVPSGTMRQAVFPPRSPRDWKILYNEMVELWGSLGEAGAYFIRGDVSAEDVQENRYLRMLRQAFLFEV